MDFNSIDWNALCQEESELSHLKDTMSQKEHWDKRAAKFGKRVVCAENDGTRGKDDYLSKMLERIEVRHGWTVLDVGCGPGALAIPLAKKAKSVTALDISSEMLKRLKSKAEDSGLSNIQYLNSSWQDAFADERVGRHDVVVASRSLMSGDMKEAMTSFASFARRAVYLTLPIVHLPFNWEACEAIGRKKKKRIRHICLYNMLFQMGIQANIEVLCSNIRVQFSSIEEAMDAVQSKSDPFSPDEKARLRKFLERKFSEQKDSPVFTHEGTSRWALIWWRKEDQ